MKQGVIVSWVVLIVFAIVLSGEGQSETAETLVWIPEYCGFKMGTIEFSIWVENEIPLTSMTFDLLYDEAVFTVFGINIGERAHGCFMNWASIDGGVRISVVCDSVEAGSGPLISFRWDEPEGLACGEPIEFTISSFNLLDMQGQSHQYESMTASLPVRYLGDVTGDCQINVIDALAVVPILFGWDPQGCTLWAIDVNEDDQYDFLDLITILNIILGYGYPEKSGGESIQD